MQNTVENNYKCDICKRDTHRIVYSLEDKLALCQNCADQLHTCRGCANRAKCDWETNPLGIQPYIVQTVSQGGVTMQRQVPNPKLNEVYCKECKCNDIISGYCMRQACGYCTKWELHEDYRKEG